MQRGFVLPILLIVVLLLSLGVGVYFLQNSRTNTKSEASSPTVNKPLPSVSFHNQTINIEDAALSFQLPPGFNFIKETEDEYFKRANGDIRQNFHYYIEYDPVGFSDSFYIVQRGETDLDKAILAAVIYENPGNLDPMQFYEKYWYYPFVWGDFTSRRNEISPETSEIIGGKTGGSGIVTYREGSPKFIYLPLPEKNLMLQIHLPTENNPTGQDILKSFTFK